MSTEVTYLDHSRIKDVKRTEAPRNPSRTGYGKKIPTTLMVKLEKGPWRRVYTAIFSNAGTSYIVLPGNPFCVLGPAAQVAIERLEQTQEQDKARAMAAKDLAKAAHVAQDPTHANFSGDLGDLMREVQRDDIAHALSLALARMPEVERVLIDSLKRQGRI